MSPESDKPEPKVDEADLRFVLHDPPVAPDTTSGGGHSHSAGILQGDEEQSETGIYNHDKHDFVIVYQKCAAITIASIFALLEWWSMYNGHPPNMLAWGLITGVFGGATTDLTDTCLRWFNARFNKRT